MKGVGQTIGKKIISGKQATTHKVKKTFTGLLNKPGNKLKSNKRGFLSKVLHPFGGDRLRNPQSGTAAIEEGSSRRHTSPVVKTNSMSERDSEITTKTEPARSINTKMVGEKIPQMRKFEVTMFILCS